MTENLNNNITKEFKVLYSKKEYKKALDLLSENAKEFDPGVYAYNEGILLLKQENFFEARLKFEKAHKLGFISTESTLALEKTKDFLGVNQLEIPTTKIEKIEVALVTTSFDFFLTISLCLLVLSFIKKIQNPIRVICFLLAFFPVGYYYFIVDKHVQKIAVETKSVFRGPSNMFEEIQLLPKGMVFITSEKLDGWVKVVYPTSHAGWIKDTNMESL